MRKWLVNHSFTCFLLTCMIKPVQIYYLHWHCLLSSCIKKKKKKTVGDLASYWSKATRYWRNSMWLKYFIKRTITLEVHTVCNYISFFGLQTLLQKNWTKTKDETSNKYILRWIFWENCKRSILFLVFDRSFWTSGIFHLSNRTWSGLN